MLVNYGMEKLRFGQAVLVDNEVRLRVEITLEIKNVKKNAFKGTAIFLYHFE